MEMLPAELALECFRHLKISDLAALARVSQAMNDLVTPMLWSRIHLLPPTGVQRTVLDLIAERLHYPSDFVSPDNNYAEAPGKKFIAKLDELLSEHDVKHLFPQLLRKEKWPQYERFEEMWSQVEQQTNNKTKPLLWTLHRMRGTERWAKIAKCIRLLSLCISPNDSRRWGNGVVEESINYWHLIFSLPRLESLKVTAEWSNGVYHPEIEAGSSLPSLSNLSSLKELTLKYYVPIPVVRYLVTLNPTTITHLDLFLLAPPVGSDTGSDRANEENADPDDEEMQYAEAIAPRSLSWMPQDLPSRLTSLTHLALRKPGETSEEDEYAESYHSIKADRNALKQWANLIRGTRATLEQLVLEQQMVINEIRQDMHGYEEPPIRCGDRPGDIRFAELVLPALIEEAEWPQLKKLVLIEFVGSKKVNLKGRFPHVDVVLEEGVYMFLNNRDGTVSWSITIYYEEHN